MSKKNQRQLHVLSQSETTFSTRQQARLIRNEALQMIEVANEFTTNTRRVNRRSAFRVVSRSLHSSEGLPFSVRKHQALTDLSNYIALAKHNKVVGLTAFNTDLLPLTHPRSTREHSMTASAMIRTHVQWVTDDPRITNEDAKALIASAMLAPANSPEKLYAITRLENLPQGHVPLEAMTAAYGGGNSAAAKRARVALQLRDRIGRWVEMFGGLGIKVKRRDGSTASLTGRAVGQNIYSPQLADVELGDGRIVAIPIRQARGGTFLPSPEAKKDGFTPAGSTADDLDDPIIDEADLTFMESPSSFDKDEKGSKQGTTKYTDQAYDVVKFDDNKRALTDLTETNKRRAEQDLDDAAVDKQGETDAESGKQFWDPEKPIYAVSRRGGTPFAYTQNWNDAQQRIQADQRFLDEEEGRTPLARITQDDNTPEDETPLVDQQDKFKKEEIARLPEAETKKAPSDFKYKVPEDTYEVTDPTAPYRSVSEYDDPASLANMFQGDELIEGLDDAMDTGLGRLTFPDGTDSDGEPTGGEQEVPAEAILKAIDEKGGDAELALAQAYDKRLGTTENEDALSAQREADREGKIGEPKKLGEVFDEVTKAPEPEPEAPVEETPVAEIPEITEDVEPSKLPALLDGLTEEEKADFQKNGDYTPYLPKDGPVEWPEGSTPPQDRILSEDERKQALELANSELSDDDLIESYNGAVKNLYDENGSAPFGIEDENNEVQTVQIPSEVLRDAIKLRDYNMDEVNGAVLNGAYDPVEEKAPIKFKKNKETGRMEHDLGDNTVVTYGKDESGNWSADATRFSPDGGVDAEESYPAKNKAEARQLAEDVINSYNETQDIIDPDDLPEQPATEEEEPVAEIPTPEAPADGKGSKSGKDPIKEGWTVDEWLTSVSKDERFHEMLTKNKDFTRLAAFFNDPTFDSPLLSDYQDKEMEGFESGDEVSAIDMGEYGFEPGPSGRVQYALDLLQDPTMSIRGGFKDWKTGERSNENIRNILKAADDQLGLAKEDLDETDVFENKAIDSVRATLAKEIAKLDKQIEKDNKKAEEDAIAPQVSYKLTGDRLDLRSGKKAPFRRQDVKDFLDDNGFDWNPDAKAETKSGMDEASAKKFLRDLRDKFGIDLLPREGQPPIDLDSKDEVIEVRPTPKVAPSAEPKEKSLREREDDEFQKFLFPDGIPEGWTFEKDGSYNEVYYIRNLTKENGDRIQGVYPKDGEKAPYWFVDFGSDEDGKERGKFNSFKDAIDFYNKKTGKQTEDSSKPDTPEDTTTAEEITEPKVKIKEATFDPENPASQEYAKETLKKLVEDRMLINEEIKNAAANGLTPEEFDALVEMRDEMNEKIDQIVNEVPTDALTSDNDISRAKKEKDEEPEDQDTKEDPIAKKSKRELKKEAKRRKELILKMIFTEFGPGALELDNPDRRAIREFTDILDTLTTAELEQIGDRLNEELGWNFFRSKKPLPKEGDVIIESEGEPSEEPEEKDEDIVDADIVPEPEPELTPEEAAEAERQRKLKEIRERKKREREDKLIEEDEKAKEKEKPTPETPETTPTTPETPATPAEKPAEGKSKKNPAKPSEEPAVAVTPRITTARTTDLKAGDVLTKDFFTVTNVEQGFEKKRDGEMVPASRVSGYYPGGAEQSSKLWADDVLFDVYRDVTPPAKGDLPELNQPKMGDYGKLTKINGEWELKDPAAQKQFEQDVEKYQEQLDTQKALWSAPDLEAPVKEFTSENTLHVVNALGKDLKPNDIAFRRDENGELSEFFVIEEVLPGTVMVPRADGKPAEEKVQIRGYYPGHESQVKSWKTGTSVEVLRGEQAANIPAKGDKPAIDSIEPGTLKGQAYKDKNAEISALRKEAGKAYTPDLTASDIPAVLVEKPNSFNRGNRPAFFGKAAELAKLKDGKAISDALKGKRVVYFDFETVGTGKFDNDNPDAPIQVAASVWEGGEKVGEINLFINPGEPLGDYYYKEDENGNKVLDPEKLLSLDGQTVDDAFLASQPSIEDQLRAFAEFAGQDAIFVAHNAEFDTNTFEKWAQKLGIDYNMDGVIDTLELAKSMTPKGNKLGQVAKRYGIEKTDEEWHDARTDSEVLPAILEGLLGDMKPDNREFDPATRLAEFEAKRSSYNEKLEAFKKQEADLAMAEAVKRGMAGEPVSIDEMLGKTKTTSGFGSEGSTDSAEEYAYESIFGGKINNSWIEDDENTFVVDEGGATVGDIKIGDFVPAEGGGYHEVVDLLADPEDPNGTIVVRKIVSTGELYSTRVTEKKSPGIGWSNGKVLKGTLRRRNELAGKTPAEIRDLVSKPIEVDAIPVVKDKTPTPKGKKSITPEETQSVVSDAIEAITSGAKSDSSVEDAVKGLPLDDTTKSAVLADREDASINHLSADGVALKVGDKVRGTKTGRIGEVRALLTTYGPRGYKNYVKVKFDDAAKRENISAGSLQIINPDDGGGFFTDPTPPATGEPVNPNVTPKSEAELVSILNSPDEPIVTDAEERSRVWKENEAKRMKYALDLNYRKVSPEALKELTDAVNNISVYDKGHKRSFIAFMPNLSTGEPLRMEYTFLKPTKDDVKKYGKEEGDILVKRGPNNTDAIIKSDGTIDYIYDRPITENFFFSVTSPNLYTAVENKNKVTFPLGENPDLQTMGMVPLDREIPIDGVVGANGEINLDFVFDDPEEEPKTLKPSAQQKAIVEAVASGKDVIVQALAGTGKTTTLKMAARAVAESDPNKIILYIAFNRSVAAEINQDPDRPSNLIARTDSQVAWHYAPAWLQDRGFDKTLISRNLDVAKYLGITPTKVSLVKKDGTKVSVELSTIETFNLVKNAVIQFSQSSDKKVMPKHFDESVDNVPTSLVDQANAWWDDISNPKGELAVNRSFFSKYVELNGIDVSKASLRDSDQKIPATDIIFFDEAQDINDVTASWVRSQKMQKVFVGDGNQSIYMFRGAKNQLETLEGAETLQLTESYRFGSNIAGIANRFLAFNGKTEKLIGLNKDQGELVSAADMPDPNAVLVRTNGGALKAMEYYLSQEKTVGISKSLKTRVVEALDTIGWLSGGKKGAKPDNYNPEIGNYDSFDELTTEVSAGRAPGIKSLYDLYVRTGAENLRELLNRVIEQEEDTEESKAAKLVYSPITIDQAEDGSSGKLSDDVSYKIVGDSIVLDVKFVKNEYYRKLLNDNLRKAGMPARKTGKQIKNSKGELKDEWVRDASIPDDLDRTDKLNKIKKTLNGIVDPVLPDLVVTTAHISKGDEWDNVLIWEDFEFFGPRPDKETGQIKMPDEQETNLAYVAVTRAKKRIALGPLSWIYEYTEDSDEQVSEEISNLQEMADIPTDPTPVTPEEFDNEVQETAKKIDPATQKIADAIIAALESGTAPWRKPWTGGGFLPTSVATGKMYEGTNILVLWAAQEANGWTDNRWLTYKQAEKLGGNIIRGQKATSIIHWTPKFKKVEQPDGTTKEVFIYTPPKIINVFNVEQAEGIDLPPLVKGEPIPVSQAEQTLLDTYKDRPEIFYKTQDGAYYSPVTDTIHLPLREQFGAEQDLFETLVHELAHSTGHPSRVNRKDLTDNYGTHKASRGEEELIAEISVALVAARLGVEIDFGNVASYAKSWLGALKNDPQMIIKAAKQAQKAVDHMLGKQEEPAKVDEDGNPIEPVGEGVGSEGKTGDQIAEDAGLKPETAPEPNLGEEGTTGEDIATETGVASIKGEYQNGTPNSGELKDGMNYEIQMIERVLNSGRTSGGTYGVRKIVISGNTFKNKEELKAAGFRYDGASKTWSKSYLTKVFNVETLTQDVVDKNPDPEITEDLSKFLDDPIIQNTSEESVGSEGKTGEEIAEDSGLKPEPTPEPNVGEQGKTGEEIAQENDIKPAGVKGGHDLSPREVFENNRNGKDADIKKVYGAEEIAQPQMQREMERPFAPERDDFEDRDSYVAAFKQYRKDFDNYYLERSRNIQSPIGEKNLNGSAKGVQNYVKDIITADWFVEAFGDGGQMGRPPVSLFTGMKHGGKYTYGFKNGVFMSSLKMNKLLINSEPAILHEIAHFATAISVAEKFDAHGIEYRMNYIFITDKVLGRKAAEKLKEAYRKENLSVG